MNGKKDRNNCRQRFWCTGGDRTDRAICDADASFYQTYRCRKDNICFFDCLSGRGFGRIFEDD